MEYGRLTFKPRLYQTRITNNYKTDTMPSDENEKPNYVWLYSKVISGNKKALESMKDAANKSSTAAYYLAVVYDNGYYRGEVSPELSLAYCCMAVYLGSPEAMEYLQKHHQPSTVDKCLKYIRSLDDKRQFDFRQISSIIEQSEESKSDDVQIDNPNPDIIEQDNYQDKRDVSNKKVKEWMMERDHFNEEVRSISREIKILLSQRDLLNKQARDLKFERDRWQQLAKEIRRQRAGNETYTTKCYKNADKKHQEMIEVVKQAESIQEKINQLSAKRNHLHDQANEAHNQFISTKELANQGHKSVNDGKTAIKTDSEPPEEPIIIPQTNDSNAIKAIFLDFNSYMDEIKFHDPTFGTGLRDQFKTSSVKTPFVDAVELFRNVFLKESVTLFLSTPNPNF